MLRPASETVYSQKFIIFSTLQISCRHLACKNPAQQSTKDTHLWSAVKQKPAILVTPVASSHFGIHFVSNLNNPQKCCAKPNICSTMLHHQSRPTEPNPMYSTHLSSFSSIVLTRSSANYVSLLQLANLRSLQWTHRYQTIQKVNKGISANPHSG